MKLKKIEEHYQENKDEIKSRIQDFKSLKNSSPERKFKELVFVILTSQTKAESAWKAAISLEENNLLFNGKKDRIKNLLEDLEIRYPKEKAKYIVENRENLKQPTLSDTSNSIKIDKFILPKDLEKSREELTENIKGISWKGASHFLRNIGYGEDIAIISNHIITQMHELGVIESSEPPKSKKDYLKLEKKLREFSKKVNIDLEELDLVLWSMKTGEVFK